MVDDFLRNVCQIEEDHYHVGLFVFDFVLSVSKSILFFFHLETPSNSSKSILNKLFSFGNESSDVVELMPIFWIGKDLVPGRDRKSFLWCLSFVKNANYAGAKRLKAEIFSHVGLLKNQFICLCELDRLVKVGQMLIYYDLLSHHRETPFIEAIFENSPDGEESEPKNRRD